MVSLGISVLLVCIFHIRLRAGAASGDTKAHLGSVQETLESDLAEERYKAACPEYQHYAVFPQ